MKNRFNDPSAMAEAMGAKVNIQGPPQSLYLVVGINGIAGLVTQAGGKIHMRFSQGKLLAVLSFDGFLMLKNHPHITRIGPVNFDMERFKKVTESIAKAAVS